MGITERKEREREQRRNDILDAAALAVAAKNIHLSGKINRLAPEPELDEKGIKMEIVYF